MPPGTPKRDVNRPPFGWPPTPVTVESMGGEGASWPSQSGAGRSSVHKKFSFTCYTRGDPRLRWGNESRSSGLCSQAGTQAHQSACGRCPPTPSQRLGAGRGCPLGVPQEGSRGFPPASTPLSDKSTLVRAQVASWGLSSPSGSPRGGGWMRTAKNCIFFISLLPLMAPSIKSWSLQTLKASCTKADDGIWGPAQAFVIFHRCQE